MIQEAVRRECIGRALQLAKNLEGSAELGEGAERSRTITLRRHKAMQPRRLQRNRLTGAQLSAKLQALTRRSTR